MVRLWRTSAGRLLIVFLLIDVAIFAFTETAGARINAHTDLTAEQIGWTALDVFLVWRVWRGGRFAWAILLAIHLIVLAQAILGSFNAYAIALYLFVIAQTLILVAPAVRDRVSRGRSLDS